MKKTLRALVILGLAGLLGVPTQARSQGKIKVLSDSPLQPALVPIAEAFRRDSGHQIEFVFGTSPVVHKKVVEGETADVLIIQPSFVAELMKSGKVAPGEYPVIGRVGFGLMARSDAPARDISNVEAFTQVVLHADALIFSNLASGNYFATVLERLNIADSVRAKVVRLPPAAVFERVIQGKGNDIGVGTIPLINVTKGLRLIGPLPAEVQSYIVYLAAPMSAAPSPDAGRSFIAFLESPAAKSLFAANGVEPGTAK